MVIPKYSRARHRLIQEECSCFDKICCMCCPDDPREQCGLCAAFTVVYSIVEYFIPITLLWLLLWLLLRPNKLRPAVDAAVLVKFSLDNATSTLNYDITVDLSFHNSHKHVGIRYFDLVAVASYGGTRLGPSVDVLPLFFQHPKATNVVHAVFQGSAAAPLAPAAAELFAREATHGSFNVLVTVTSTFMYMVPYLKPVYCYDNACYIQAAPHSGGTTPAIVSTPRTLCHTKAHR